MTFCVVNNMRSLLGTGVGGGIDELICDPELNKHNSLVIRLMHECVQVSRHHFTLV